MIYVDPRIGSKDLMLYFKHWGVDAQIAEPKLEFGDVKFDGKGPSGIMKIGVEVKTISDLLASITSGRFVGHQLPGLILNYNVTWLLVEGQYSCDFGTGMLMHREGTQSVPMSTGNRRFMYRDVDSWLTSMEMRGGMKIRRTMSRPETARVIADLHNWWNKDWDEHHAHLAFSEIHVDGQILIKPKVFRRMVAELPGIGWERSKAVAAKFSEGAATLEDALLRMVTATQKQWEEIDGIGKIIAAKTRKLLEEKA